MLDMKKLRFYCEESAQRFFILGLMVVTFATVMSPLILSLVFFFTRYWIFVIFYLIWCVYDRETGFKRTRRCNWYVTLFLWKYVCDYFPIRLIKTAEINPKKNYLFATFPHGCLPLGCLKFVTNANKIRSETFPGIDFYGATWRIILYWPLLREFFLMFGMCSVDETSLVRILSEEPSKAIVMYPGAPSEIQYASKGTEYVILARRRKGFVRIALQTGAALVPVFAFGEINKFRKFEFKSIPSSLLINKYLRNGLGPNLGFWYGKGPWKSCPGPLPEKVPLNIIGKPISVPKEKNPSEDLINEYHAKFLKALEELFETYKLEYDAVGGQSFLTMI